MPVRRVFETTFLMQGDVKERLCQYAEEQSIDLIIALTAGVNNRLRKGYNLSSHLQHHAPCPVLAIPVRTLGLPVSPLSFVVFSLYTLAYRVLRPPLGQFLEIQLATSHGYLTSSRMADSRPWESLTPMASTSGCQHSH